MTGEAAVIGSLVVVLLAGGLVIYVTTIYRQSRALAKAALTGSRSDPIELVCGIRYRGANATWPEGQIRIQGSGVQFSGLGTTEVATWEEVSGVRLIRPLTLIGWGLTFSLTNPARTITVWLSSRGLASRVLEACSDHGVPVTSGSSITV